MAKIFAIIYYIYSYTNKIPAIAKAIKTKKTEDYSLSWAVLNMISTVSWTLYILLTDQTFIVKLGCIIDFVLISTWLILVFYYKKKD